MTVGGGDDFRTVDLTLPPRPKHTFLMSNFSTFCYPEVQFPKQKTKKKKKNSQLEELYAITRVNK